MVGKAVNENSVVAVAIAAAAAVVEYAKNDKEQRMSLARILG
jgi:hypothetical protein